MTDTPIARELGDETVREWLAIEERFPDMQSKRVLVLCRALLESRARAERAEAKLAASERERERMRAALEKYEARDDARCSCGSRVTHGEGDRYYCSNCGNDRGARIFP